MNGPEAAGLSEKLTGKTVLFTSRRSVNTVIFSPLILALSVKFGFSILKSYLGTVALIISTPFVALLSLYGFSSLYPALGEIGILAIISYLAVRRHNKYHRKEKYNDQYWEKKKDSSRWGVN
jgi:hypothetical protein